MTENEHLEEIKRRYENDVCYYEGENTLLII